MKRFSTFCPIALLLLGVLAVSAFAQITPIDDAYTVTSSPTTNFGAKNTLEVATRTV
jgi:hypothetical protein